MNKKFNEQTIQLLKNDSKIGILMTSDAEHFPHLTLISSIQALGDSKLTWGQHCVGLSKKFIIDRPDCAFMALNADYQYVSGRARFDHIEKTGEVFDEYNNKPLYRYNSYFGFHTIFFMNLLEVTDIKNLQVPKIAVGALMSRVKALFVSQSGKKALNLCAKGLFSQLDGLKFLGYFTEDGKPEIIPVIQAGPAGTDRIAFCGFPFGSEVEKIPEKSKVAVFAVNLKLQSVLIKGTYTKKGVVDIERVYNSMPPKMEYIYPRPEKPEPVTEF